MDDGAHSSPSHSPRRISRTLQRVYTHSPRRTPEASPTRRISLDDETRSSSPRRRQDKSKNEIFDAVVSLQRELTQLNTNTKENHQPEAPVMTTTTPTPTPVALAEPTKIVYENPWPEDSPVATRATRYSGIGATNPKLVKEQLHTGRFHVEYDDVIDDDDDNETVCSSIYYCLLTCIHNKCIR